MKYKFVLPDKQIESEAMKPFEIYRVHIRPALEQKRAALDAMYDPVMGRPEMDPVILMGVSILQIMERLPDRQAVWACLYDVRWRLALGLPCDWQGFDPSSLVYFRKRVIQNDQAKLALDAALDAMRKTGYLKIRGPVRIDSTHILAAVAHLSRLECVRETLRLTLDFLSAFGGSAKWEPWFSRYASRNPKELHNPSAERLKATMNQAGEDARDILLKTKKMGKKISESDPVLLLQRVFEEQFAETAAQEVVQLRASPSGSVHSPHDPDATWSTKGSLGKAGWVGSKLQVCETAPEINRQKGEPTEAVITAVMLQPAITSDHGSIAPVLAAHMSLGQEAPATVFSDAGYISAPALKKAEDDGYELCGPMPAPPYGAKRFGSDSFEVDTSRRQAVCPAGKSNSTCAFITESRSKASYYYFTWSHSDCKSCHLQCQCLSKKQQSFRTLQVGKLHMFGQARRQLCRSEDYQRRMHRRSGVEGTNSELKRGYGLRCTRYRGNAKTNLQSIFTATACNIRRWSARLRWLDRENSKQCV